MRIPVKRFLFVKGEAPPTNPDKARAVARIQRAYAMEKATFKYGDYHTVPDGPGEGPGMYGVCCNRATNCNCEGEAAASGIFHVGTRQHHDAYHTILGETNHVRKKKIAVSCSVT